MRTSQPRRSTKNRGHDLGRVTEARLSAFGDSVVLASRQRCQTLISAGSQHYVRSSSSLASKREAWCYEKMTPQPPPTQKRAAHARACQATTARRTPHCIRAERSWWGNRSWGCVLENYRRLAALRSESVAERLSFPFRFLLMPCESLRELTHPHRQGGPESAADTLSVSGSSASATGSPRDLRSSILRFLPPGFVLLTSLQRVLSPLWGFEYSYDPFQGLTPPGYSLPPLHG